MGDTQDCDDFDSEIWEIFHYEEPRTEFTSMPPRGLIRPVAIRAVPALPLDVNHNRTSTEMCTSYGSIDDSLTQTNKISGYVSEVRKFEGQISDIGGGDEFTERFDIPDAKKCDQLDNTQKNTKSSADTSDKKEKKSFLDRLRNLFRRIRG